MLDAIKEEPFWSPEELAKKFKISLSSVYKLVRSGEIPSIRLGKVYRIPGSALIRYLEKKQRLSAPQPIPKTAKTFRTILRKAHGDMVHEIYLYGSYARGDFNEDSDIDLCVILNTLDPAVKMNINTLVEKAMALNQYEELLSVRVENLDSWNRMKRGNYPLVQNILREGVSLWRNH